MGDGIGSLYVNPYAMPGMGLIGNGQPAPPPPPQQVSILGGGGSDAQALARAQTVAQSQNQGAPASPWMQGATKALGASMGLPQTQQQGAPADTGPRQLYGVGSGTPGVGGQAQDDRPLNIPTARMLTTKPQDIQTGTDIMVKGIPRIAGEFHEAEEDKRRAELEKNEADVQSKVGEAGQIEGARLERETKDAKTDEQTEAAHKDWIKNATEDPDHYQNSMKTGKRIGLTISAALMQMGMGLRGQNGANPILEQIENETKRDIAAQKNKADKLHSIYSAALEKGMSEKQAHALAEKTYLQAGKLSLESARLASNSPTIDAAAKQANAEIDQKTLDATSRQYGHSQGGVSGVGGWTDKMAKEALDRSNESKGAVSIDQARRDVARAHGVSYSGGPAETSAWGANGANGPGRSAGVQLEAQNNLARIQSFKTQLAKAESMISSGGKVDAARTAEGHTLLHAMAAELGYVNAGKSPNETELSTAKDMLPSDLNSFQFTGSDKAKLAQVRAIIEEKEALARQAMRNVGSGQGFAPGQGVDLDAAMAGATEK